MTLLPFDLSTKSLSAPTFVSVLFFLWIPDGQELETSFKQQSASAWRFQNQVKDWRIEEFLLIYTLLQIILDPPIW